MLAAWDLLRAAAADGFAPPPDLTVSQWADAYRMLSSKGAAEPGPYRSDRTPYVREPADLLSESSDVECVVLQWGAQVGKSEAGNNWLGYVIDVAPGPIMAVQPTIDLAKRYSRQRIAPMVLETPRLRDKVSENRSRDEANTTLLKDFPGGVLLLAGANSAAGLRSMPVRYLFLDEIDAFPLDVDGEGDPVGLAERRTATFARRKILKTSTPTLRDFSRIEAAYLAGDRRRYHVPCPHCQVEQVLAWPNVRWQRDDVGAPIPGTVRYACAHCATLIEEHHKPYMLAHGRWIAEGTAGRVASFHLSALYSPLGWYSWETAAAEFYEANEAAKAGDVSKLRAWTNTVLAETWEDAGDKVSEGELQRRAEPLERRTVPERALVLVAGVDVQADRLEAYVWAYGPGEESWLVEREVLHGSPSELDGPTSPWVALDALLEVQFAHGSGGTLSIAATAIDSGGHHTSEVYHYARTRAWRRVLAVKGQSQAGKPVLGKPTDLDVNFRGVKLRKGVKLWPVGADTGKATLYGRLRLAAPGPGYVHLPTWAPREVFEQITAERLATRYVKGRPKLEWLKPAGRRNEALDCTVYALAAAHFLGLPRWRAPDWERLRAKLAQRSLLPESNEDAAAPDSQDPAAPAAPSAPPPDATPRTPRRVGRIAKPKGFVGRW
ncbi:MAG TPA: phage terminase large subunit family protein [Burkholderiaceae bacterium]|nr:phage terminase large subunit family protein [Rubrivivax sp.]HRZ02172.1 phage terminase large subunit family protein [Burkholderiaceae bacterium]HRZ59908.1 phage terminase large subunit family protein [Rubrivivax sp.]